MFLIAAAIASLNNDFAGMMLFFLLLTAQGLLSVGCAIDKSVHAVLKTMRSPDRVL